MKKKNNKHGFTLAELLIVVAIIAVLTAIAIPVFSSQLEKAKEGTDISNIRSDYAEITTALLTGDLAKSGDKVYVGNNLEATLGSDLPSTKDATFTITVANAPIQQKQEGWQTASFNIAGVDKDDISLGTLADKLNVAYTFKLAEDGDYVLSGIAVGSTS